MTHEDVIAFAARWARRTKRCPIVLSDVRCNMVSEQPDVIAWKNWGQCIVVECKASRGDFLRDGKKWFRRSPELGMGHERWMAAPLGVATPEELPERWGLVVVGVAGGMRIVRKAEPFTERNERSETALLISALRRATEGWGRRIFGDEAPPLVDGDPHPSASKVIRELRAEVLRLRATQSSSHDSRSK